MNGPNGYYTEYIDYKHKGKDYHVVIEVYDHDEWSILNVQEWDEEENDWIDMKIVSAELTKIQMDVINKYVEELDKPYVSSDYDYKDLMYDQETP